MKVYTRTLSSGTLTISANDGANMLSIQSNDSSSCQVLGGISFQGIASSSITISNGEGLTITSTSSVSPIDGVTITWLSGTIDVLIGF